MSGDAFAASAIIIAVSTKRKRQKRKRKQRAELIKLWLVRRLSALMRHLSELQMEEESEYKLFTNVSRMF